MREIVRVREGVVEDEPEDAGDFSVEDVMAAVDEESFA